MDGNDGTGSPTSDPQEPSTVQHAQPEVARETSTGQIAEPATGQEPRSPHENVQPAEADGGDSDVAPATIQEVTPKEETSVVCGETKDLSQTPQELVDRIKAITRCDVVHIRETGEIEILPKGWTTRESKSNEGKKYYVSPYGQTQWLRPLVKTGIAYKWLMEVEVSFGPGRLGLNLKQVAGEAGVVFSDLQVFISEIYKLSNGLASPAEIYNWSVKPEKRLHVGMRVTAIDGVPMTGYSYAEVLDLLSRSTRPVRIKFADVSKGIVGHAKEEVLEESKLSKEVREAINKQKNLRNEYLEIVVTRELHAEVWTILKKRLDRWERELSKKLQILSREVEQISQREAYLKKEEEDICGEEQQLQETIEQLKLQEAGKVESAEQQKAKELALRNEELAKEIAELLAENDQLRQTHSTLETEYQALQKSLDVIEEEEKAQAQARAEMEENRNSLTDFLEAVMIIEEDDIEKENVLETSDSTSKSAEEVLDIRRRAIELKFKEKLQEMECEIAKQQENSKTSELQIQKFKKQLTVADAEFKREEEMISGEKPPKFIFLEDKIEALRKHVHDSVVSLSKASTLGDTLKVQQLSERRTRAKKDLIAAIDEMDAMEKELNIKSTIRERQLSVLSADGSETAIASDDEGGGNTPGRLAKLQSELTDTSSQLTKARSGKNVTLVRELSEKECAIKEEIKSLQDQNSTEVVTRNSTSSTPTAATSVAPAAPHSNPLRASELSASRASSTSTGSRASGNAMTLTLSGNGVGGGVPTAPGTILTGLLMKHPAQHKEKGFLNNMKKMRGARERWCTLEASGVLKYYKKSKDKEPRGEISLVSPDFEIVCDLTDKSCVEFTLVSEKYNTRFLAKSNAEMLQWVTAMGEIRAACSHTS